MASDPPPLVVMTVAGPLCPADALAAGPALCREWLVNDQSSLLVKGQVEEGRPEPGDTVELGRLAALRRWPTSSLHNLHIGCQDALRELAGNFRRSCKGGLVLISTPSCYCSVASSRHAAAVELQSVSQESGIQLVLGTLPPGTNENFEAEVASLVSDLACGFGGEITASDDIPERVKPGFIGEIFLPDCSTTSLAACVEAQRRSQAPLMLSGAISREAFSVLEGGSEASGPCLWEKCAFFDVPAESEVPASEILGRGAFIGFCAPTCGADVAWESYPHRRPIKSEADFLTAILASPANRTLVGSGIRFRTDLAVFGGPGLGYAPSLLKFRAGQPAREEALRTAAVSFLQYPWQPPPPPEKVIHEITCHWCGTKKLEGEHFSKMGFDYCSPKCIGKHRQADFKADVRGV